MTKQKAGPFDTTKFTPTEWSTEQDKREFANHFAGFVRSDFDVSLFSREFYRQLSNCFGHIAHYNLAGFYDCWFSSIGGKVKFLGNIARYAPCGDPKFTYSDVEAALKRYCAKESLLSRYELRLAMDLESLERAELKRLQDKYPS